MRAIRWIVISFVLLNMLIVAGPIQAGTESPGGVSDGSGITLPPPEPLSEFLVTDVQGGYAAAGTAMRNLGSGRIRLENVPPNSTVERAFLYWNLIGEAKPRAEYAFGVFEHQPFTGDLVAAGLSPCWGDPKATRSYTYRIEVTDFLDRDITGIYSLSEFASGRSDGAVPSISDPLPYLEGATLVVIYQNERYPTTKVFLYEGASMTSPETGPALTRITGVPEYDSYLAYTTYVIADGQTAREGPAGIGASTVLAPVPEVDADGTDPLDRLLGDYPDGNFWDTDRESPGFVSDDWGISVGETVARIRRPGERSVSLYGGLGSSGKPGEVADCLVHVAQVLSVSDGSLNTDGDAMADASEANGFDENGDGKIDVDLPALGANPFHKDLYLWMDYMTGLRPTDETLSDMVEVFNRGNVVNPDWGVGVHLHTRLGNELPYRANFVSSCGTLPIADSPLVLLNATRATSLDPALRTIYHYELWVDWSCPGESRGGADGIPGDAAIVATAELSTMTTRPWTHRALHEFGHSLGLGHGGPGAMMSNAYAPNHLSIMSYLYPGVFYSGAYKALDFQRMDMPALDENCLDETVGFGSSDPILRDIGLVQWYYADLSVPTMPRVLVGESYGPGVAADPIDWNQDGHPVDTCLALSIDEKWGAAPVNRLEVLPAVPAEWPRLVYDGGDVGGASPEGPPPETP